MLAVFVPKMGVALVLLPGTVIHFQPLLTWRMWGGGGEVGVSLLLVTFKLCHTPLT